MPANLTFQRAERTFVVALGPSAPAPDEWDHFVSQLEENAHQLSGVLLFSAGGSIDAKQREQLEQLTSRDKLRISVLTDSSLVRGMVTALKWLGVDIADFEPGREAEAVEHLGVAEESRPAVLVALQGVIASVLPAAQARRARLRQRSGPRPTTRPTVAPRRKQSTSG